MDRISLLPDEILGHILSFLPIRQAVSTSLLSKRWKNVFLLVSTLDLHYDDSVDFEETERSWDFADYNRGRNFMEDFDSVAALRSLSHHYHNVLKTRRSLDDNRRKFMDFVESLFSRPGKSPIKKLTLKIYDLDKIRVESWIRNVLERGVVEDLNLCYIKKGQFLSSLIFKNNTLVNLTLEGGFETILSKDVYLPKLKTLCLDWRVHSNVFETLLPRCPVLEELVIHSSWVKGGSVSSRSLKKLTIRRFSNLQTISFDLPNLVYLELSCFSGPKYVCNLDSLVEARLNLLECESRLKKLRRGSAHLIPSQVSVIMIQMRNVRVLHLTSGALEMFYFSGQELPKFDNLVRLCISSEKTQGWQILPLVIKNSPNLETLIFKGLKHYQTTNCGDVCVCTGSKKNNTSSCLSSCRIKVLEIWNNYKGSSEELNQMKHFLKKLPCLELVKIKVVNNVNVPKYIQQLLKLPRASSNCKIQAI